MNIKNSLIFEFNFWTLFVNFLNYQELTQNFFYTLVMPKNDDVMYRNHCVSKQAKDSMVDSEDRVQLQFTRLVMTPEGKKYIRATVNAGKTQFMEIVKNYGLELSGRWEIWSKKDNKNLPYTEV